MDLTCLSSDELIDQVTTWAGRVATGEARLLALIGELDAREAWAASGVLSCAHWLSWRLGLSLTTAYERVRVASALRALPLTSAGLSEGRISYSQVRAITRVATAADEQRWVDLARHSTGAQLEQAARGAARAGVSEKGERPRRLGGPTPPRAPAFFRGRTPRGHRRHAAQPVGPRGDGLGYVVNVLTQHAA